MSWYDFLLEKFIGVPADHRHDCPPEITWSGDLLPTLPPGTPVFCHFTLCAAEHTGICMGDCIVHLDGTGKVCCSTPAKFLARLDGTNLSTNIYYAARAENTPLASAAIADRARQQIGRQLGYNLLTNNCHDFSIGCITGTSTLQNWRLHDVERAITHIFQTPNWQWRCWQGWNPRSQHLKSIG